MTDQSGRPEGTAVCAEEEVPKGGRLIVDVDGRSVGIFSVDGELVAYLNRCPHRLAPVCMGGVSGTLEPSVPGEFSYAREGQVLKCPWHGWEFDLTTGRSLFNDQRGRLARCSLTVLDGTVFVALPGGGTPRPATPSRNARTAQQPGACAPTSPEKD